MPADTELPPVHVGDHVTDRDDQDDDGATLLVVGLSPQPANHYSVDGDSMVADYNPQYPEDDNVVEVVYPQRSTGDVSALQTYAFPRSRLELTASLHERDSGEEHAGKHPEPPAGTELVDGDTAVVGPDREFVGVQLVAMRDDTTREVITETDISGAYGLAALPSVWTSTADEGDEQPVSVCRGPSGGER